jgi:hypothetical protein
MATTECFLGTGPTNITPPRKRSERAWTQVPASNALLALMGSYYALVNSRTGCHDNQLPTEASDMSINIAIFRLPGARVELTPADKGSPDLSGASPVMPGQGARP